MISCQLSSIQFGQFLLKSGVARRPKSDKSLISCSTFYGRKCRVFLAISFLLRVIKTPLPVISRRDLCCTMTAPAFASQHRPSYFSAQNCPSNCLTDASPKLSSVERCEH